MDALASRDHRAVSRLVRVPSTRLAPANPSTGFIFHDKHADNEQLSRDVLGFLDAGDPPIVFTTGTAMKHDQPENAGRLMSLLLFASTGLIPVSMALSGVVSRVDVTALLIISGALIMLISLARIFNPTVRAMEPSQAGDKARRFWI